MARLIHTTKIDFFQALGERRGRHLLRGLDAFPVALAPRRQEGAPEVVVRRDRLDQGLERGSRIDRLPLSRTALRLV